MITKVFFCLFLLRVQ